MKLDMNSLNKAITYFNEWSGAARIYLNTDDGKFEANVYTNVIYMSSQVSTDNYICVYSKDEIDSHKSISIKRKKYIEEYSKLILDGYNSM